MAETGQHKNYTAADLEKYHKGQLSAKEMHELERAALDDPFLEEALEGYSVPGLNVPADLSELEKRLAERTTPAKLVNLDSPKRSFTWWRVAAAIVIVSSTVFIAVRISSNSRIKSTVAEVENKEVIQPAQATTDSGKSAKNDTAVVATTGMAGAKSDAKEFKRRSTVSVSPKKKETNNQAIDGIVAPVSVDEKQPRTGVDSTLIRNNTANITNNKQADNSDYRVSRLMSFNNKETAPENKQRMNYFRGHVEDADKNALPFANVTNTRDNVGTYADVHGNFVLISPDSTMNVQVRSVGFQNKITQLRYNISANRVVLQDDNSLAERVISHQKRDTSGFAGSAIKFEEPEPADGWSNYDVYLANNVVMPGELKDAESRGEVELSFDVDKKGKPVDIKVEKSLCQKCDEEAVRLIKQGPKWKNKGRKAKRVVVAVPFDTDQ